MIINSMIIKKVIDRLYPNNKTLDSLTIINDIKFFEIIE